MNAIVKVPGLPDYVITDEDKLWAARAAHWEGGDDAGDTLWTWTQRHALPNYRRRYPKLASLIQAHSQPVNPIWRRDGARCRPGGSHHGTDDCAERRLRNRDTAASMAFSQVRPEVQAKVNAWASGTLPNPAPRAVDFAAPKVARSFLNRVAGSELLKQAGNWFVGTRESLTWPDNFVRMVPSGSAARIGARIGPAVVVGLVLVGALGIVWWNRRD